MDFALLVFSGALVGFAVGLTGVGGGSLMTPILLLFNYPAAIAIGTDLLYAAFTKAGGVYFHHRKGNIRWRPMLLMAAGSIPVSLLIHLFIIDEATGSDESFERLLTTFLGVMLILTALVILFQEKIRKRFVANGKASTNGDTASSVEPPYYAALREHTDAMTVLLGIVLGICVTFSSVGAGAFGAAILFLLYPTWMTVRVVGTDIAHAVPLTFVAGMGYLFNGLVDFSLLLALMLGALPGIYLGTHMGSLIPDRVMRPVLATILFALGIYFSLRS